MADEKDTDAAALQAEFDKLTKDIGELTEIVQGLMTTAAEQAEAELKARAAQATYVVADELEVVERAIQRNPLQSVLIAFLAGIVFDNFARR